MATHGYTPVPRKGRGFFSTLVVGVSAVLCTGIVGGTLLAGYGMSIVDAETGTVFEFVQETIQGIPELAESLPPVLADLVNDERRPDYADQLDISVSLAEAGAGGRHRVQPMVHVRNRGREVVSLLSMRIVVLGANGEPLGEINEWAATPIAADDCWRGPLLPGANRHFASRPVHLFDDGSPDDLDVEIEVSDVRIWKNEQPTTVAAAH